MMHFQVPLIAFWRQDNSCFLSKLLVLGGWMWSVFTVLSSLSQKYYAVFEIHPNNHNQTALYACSKDYGELITKFVYFHSSIIHVVCCLLFIHVVYFNWKFVPFLSFSIWKCGIDTFFLVLMTFIKRSKRCNLDENLQGYRCDR